MARRRGKASLLQQAMRLLSMPTLCLCGSLSGAVGSPYPCAMRASCAIMARLPRFERGTCRLGGGCSILLSYRREGAGADSTIYCGRAHQPRRTQSHPGHSITPRESAPAALVTHDLPHFLSGLSNAILSTSVNAGKTRAWPETQSLKSHLT